MKNDIVVCPNCNQPMDPIDLSQVPAEDIINFVSSDGNKLEENWYWCPKCDCYEQQSAPPRKLSAEEMRIKENLQSMMADWWL